MARYKIMSLIKQIGFVEMDKGFNKRYVYKTYTFYKYNTSAPMIHYELIKNNECLFRFATLEKNVFIFLKEEFKEELRKIKIDKLIKTENERRK